MSGTETGAGREWFEGGDGHGYVYQYIGPIHYLCECGDYFLNRDRWIAHKATVARDEEVAALQRELALVACAACGARRRDVTLWSQIVAISDGDVVCCLEGAS